MSEELLRERLNRLSAEVDGNRPPCPDIGQLAAYADGSLPDDDRAALEDHLADCGGCLGQVRFLLRSEALGAAPEVPADLLEKVHERAAPVWHRQPAWFAAAAGLLLVVLTVRFGVIGEPSPGPAGGSMEAPVVDREDPPRSRRNHVPDSAAPTVTHPLNGQRLDRGSLTIAWEPVGEAFDYSVQLMDAEGNLIWEGRTGARSTTVPGTVGLESGESYFVRVVARLRKGLRAKSPAVAFTLE